MQTLLSGHIFCAAGDFDSTHRVQNGMTPLHKAASRGQWGVVEMLLSRGANVHAADKVSWLCESADHVLKCTEHTLILLQYMCT
jgi:Ankyrin repeat